MSTFEIPAKLKCVWEAGALLGEGSYWHKATDRLFWLDINGRYLHSYTPANGTRQSWPLSLRVGAVAVPPANWTRPDQDYDISFVAGTEEGFVWLLLKDTKADIVGIANPETHLPGNRFNDGKLGPDGRFYAGSMDDAEKKATGALYALNDGKEVVKLDEGYMVTNGPAFSPDGRIVYHSDSARQTIYCFSLGHDGRLRDKRVLRKFASGDGYPDGMTSDARGNLWVAMWDGWRIEKLDGQGQTVGVIKFPVSRVTSCSFAGDNERCLFATTASIGTHPDEQPLAGALFRIDLR